MNNKTVQSKKKRISILAIIEVLILAFGILLSISSTLKPLPYTLRYVWCFAFVLLGIAMIAVLIVLIRKRFVWLLGFAFIIIYLFAAGSGAFTCELNASRLRRVDYFRNKEVIATINDTTYTWDGESVLYDRSNLESIDYSTLEKVIVTIDGEESSYGLLHCIDSSDLAIEVYGGGTGIFLILSPKE
jgi:hypothetical protein